MRKLVSVIAVSLFFAGATPADAVDAKNTVDIKEWEVSFGGRSRDPYAEAAKLHLVRRPER